MSLTSMGHTAPALHTAMAGGDALVREAQARADAAEAREHAAEAQVQGGGRRYHLHALHA